MTDKIDYDIVATLSVEIGRYIKKIVEYIPKEKEPLIKHLAGASIHMALFMQDVYTDADGINEALSETISQFIENCGCKEWIK